MKTRFINIILMMAISVSCSLSPTQVEMIPIQDNPEPRLMPRVLFSDAPDSLISALGLEKGIPSSVCAFLIKSQGKHILFDAANGAPDSRLLSVLDSCNVSPDDIDFIFITHLHGDHIGGLMKDDTPTFRNAELYINKIEYDAWMAMPQDQNARIRSIAEAYGSRMKIFDADEVLPCGIEAVEAYGHTPGHTAYRITDILIVGDIMHGVALQLEHPQYCARFDMDKEQAVTSRKEILKMAMDNGLKMYGMHFPDPYFIQQSNITD